MAAVRLTAEQRTVLAAIKRIGREQGASAKEIKAAIETGLVESGLRNLPGGDADSAGWRQERASLYKNPTNLDASIRRFFAETHAVKGKYASAGDLAAAVQRPARAFRGRYQGTSGQAQGLLGSSAGAGGVGAQGTTTTTTTPGTPGVDNHLARAALVQQFLGRRDADPIDLALGVRNLQDVAPTPATTHTTHSAGAHATPGHAGSKLLELFWQGPGGINAKNGKAVPQGFVSGHKDHVHVAAGPKTVIALGELAQKMGLHVGENPRFGKVNPVHVTGSYHYKNEAIDVSGDPAAMRAYAHRVAAMYGIR
jgi:hypothetical protein